jgi:hypothetical protein
MLSRFAAALIPIMAIGCNQMTQLAGPQELGLVEKFPVQDLPVALTSSGDANQMQLERNEILSKWVLKSDYLCAEYQLRLSRAIRDTRLATDFVATVLSGLATIFSQVGTIRPLAGSATIALGVGGDIQSDLFLQQAGDLMANAIEAIRTAARKDLQQNWLYPYYQYTLPQGLLDVERYDRETCNIDRAMNVIRASLGIAGPTALTLNNPIVGVLKETSTSTVPQTTTVTTTPGTTTTTPQGATISTSPQVQVFTTPTQPSEPTQIHPPPPRKALPGPGVQPPRCQPPESAAVIEGKRQLKEFVRGLGTRRDLDSLNSIVGRIPDAATPAPGPTVKANAIIVYIDRTVCTSADLERLSKAVSG